VLGSRFGFSLLGIWLGIVAVVLCACTLATPQAAPAGDPAVAKTAPAAPRADFTKDAFITADGERLPLREWLPQGPPKAVVLALHGFNDYSDAFEMPARIWARDGIATYAYDQRGFGAAPERGRWPGRAALAADAALACSILKRRYPAVPLYLIGESMGAAVGVIAMTGESGTPVADVDGVVLVAPAVWGRATMDLAPRVALFVGVRFLPALKLTGQSLHILASDNIPMLRGLARDPLVIKATRVDAIWGLVNLMDAALDAAPRLHGRVLVMYGAHDEIIPKPAMRRFVRALPRDLGEHSRVAYYRHGYHMLLRDLEGALVSADVAGWVLAPRAPLLSGADRGDLEAELAAVNAAAPARQ
jgi:acylglycerol lipase